MKNLLIASTLLIATGCSSIDLDKKWQGAIIGTATGALAGGIIGHQSGKKGQGALIGGVVGGLTGTFVGHKMEQSDQK